MSYIVYQTATVRAVKEYQYEGAALNYIYRLGCKGYAVTTKEKFLAMPIPMKKVKSLMTGKEVEIPVDTPRSCDPSSELFWTM